MSRPCARVRRGGSPLRIDGWSGFRVESECGRIGVVAVVRADACSEEPAELVGRACKIGKSVLLIGAEDVDVVIPERRRLVLRPGWRLLATGASPAVALP